MKKITFYLIVFLLTNICYSQCPTTNFLEFNSQAEVDEFLVDYPNCTELNTQLRIGVNPGSESDITNLDAFANIEIINGHLNLQNNPLLTSLEPFFGVILNNPGENSLQNHTIINSPLITTLEGLFSPETFLNGPGLEISAMNGLTSLAGLENLTGIEGMIYLAGNEQLTNIDALSNISGEIGSIVIGGHPNLESISGLEGITGLSGDFTFFGFLLWINDNDLIEDLNSLSNIQTVNDVALFDGSRVFIDDNASLQNIDGISQLDFSILSSLEFRIRDNSNLSICNVESVCGLIANDDNADIIINNNNTYCTSIADVINECNLNLNSIVGSVLYDFNNNGCDPDDYNAQSILVETTNGSTTIGTFTNSDGSYGKLLDFEGAVTTSIIETSLPDGYVATPENVDNEFIGFGNEAIVDFCLNATEEIDDLKISLLPITAARPGFNSEYRLIYENRGSIIQDGNVTFIFDETVQNFIDASVTPTSISGNTITWDFTNMLPFETRFINIELNHLAPPINEVGDRRIFEALVEDEGDESPIDNRSILDQILIGSFDPNDIRVAQGDEIFETETENYLDYIVRFQNTGTADAIKVRVDHILSDQLDWATLRPLSSSHTYRTQIVDGNQVSFFFDNINLPAQQDDAEGSQGFIAFQVRPKETFSLGDSTAARASIFFDFNEPIVTNEVTTTVVEEPLNISENILETLVDVWPNPASDYIAITTSNVIEIEKITIHSFTGQNVLSTITNEYIDIKDLATGIYFITINTNMGILNKKIIKQ